MIGKTISHYRILEKLGEGGMGVVYKAQDIKLKRTVALKFLPPELLCDSEAKTRFLHEAQAASALNHPNITTIYDVDEVDQRCFISMEYVEGKSLQSLIYERPFRIDEILRISVQIAEGLKAAHKKEVVHRDIKSANIMVSDEGETKIMDFGLAKLKGATKLTKTGTTLGTFQYMSPEQAQGKEVDHRSDIFSLGVVLYEMICQKLPFTGEHDAAIIYSVINERHKPLNQMVPAVSPKLERIVDRALIKDRDKRYQNMDELLADLKELSSTYPETRIIQKKRQYPIIASLSVLAIVFLLVLAYFVAKPRNKLPSGESIPVDQTQLQVAEKKKSLAVMYLENLSGGEEADLIRAGLTEGLISNLNRITQVLVVPKKEILDFKDKKVDPREIVDKTGAKYILSGTIQIIGQTIRLTMQLLDPLTNTVLWLDKYPCTEKELFDVQDKIALQVFDKLGINLTDEQKTLFRKKEEISEKAQKLIERGLYYYDNKSYSLALESFQGALEEDKTYFRTHYYLGQTYQAMERWKEAIEEYQLTLPETEKFKRIKYNYQTGDSLQNEYYWRELTDGKIFWSWYESKENTLNWKCFDMLQGKMLFERKEKMEKGFILPTEKGFTSYYAFSSEDTLPNKWIYAINEKGERLWEFGGSNYNFEWPNIWENYITAVNKRADSIYIFDISGRLLTKIKGIQQGGESYSQIEDSCFFSYDDVTKIIRFIDLKDPDNIDTLKIGSYEHFRRDFRQGFIFVKNDSTNKIVVYSVKDLIKKYDLNIPSVKQNNWGFMKNLVFCFSDDGYLYALKFKKPFYSSRVAWKTYIGTPDTTRSLLGGRDTLLAVSQNGDIHGIDVKQGKIVFRINVGSRINQQRWYGWIQDGNFVSMSSNEIALFDLESGQLRWSKDLIRGRGCHFMENKKLIILWTSENLLSRLSVLDGTSLFNFRTSYIHLLEVNDRIFMVVPSFRWIKELNLMPYDAPGHLQEHVLLKEMAICYFNMEDNNKADSIFSYIINDLRIDDPDCFYYKYEIEKRVGRRDTSIVCLEAYYDLIKDTNGKKEEEARQIFLDDFGVSIINSRAIEHWESFRRVFDLDSLLLITSSSSAGFSYSLEPPRAMYKPGTQRLSLYAIDKSTGLSVWDTTIDGVLPRKILPKNMLLFDNYVHNTSAKRVGFSINLFGLDSKKLIWERQLIEGSDETSCFKVLRADSNHICAYFQDPFWPSGVDANLSRDSADFHFWLISTETGEVEKEKQIRLSADTNTFTNIYADEDYVLIPLEKKIIVLDIETFERHWQIDTSVPITSLTSNENIIYIGTLDKCYSAYDGKTRNLVWRSNLPFTLESGYIPAITYLRENTFLDYWDNKSVFCFDTRPDIPDEKRVRWRFQVASVCPEAGLSNWQNWHIEKDKLFINLDNCKEFTYIILERNTGKFLKGVKLPWVDLYGSQVVISDNTIYCLTGDGVF